MYMLVDCFPQQAPAFLEDLLVRILGLMFSPTEPEACKREYAIFICRVILGNSSYFDQLLGRLQQAHQSDLIPLLLDLFADVVRPSFVPG
jgi:hypothetical protein